MGVYLEEEQEREFDEIIIGREEAAEEAAEATQPEGTDTESEAELTEPLTPDEIKDLALWMSKAQAWHSKGKGGAVDWENKHLREEISAPIRLKLAAAKSPLDIVKAFKIGKVKETDSVKALADAIEKAVNEISKPV